MPQAVSAELRRVTDRWRSLPLARAQERVPLVRRVLSQLADAGSPGAGLVPDLGPGALADQLTVLVHDACRAGVPGLEETLARLRRGL